jgi:tRNA-2-methylthio-N6-dimethylallyladenosine synthase
MGKVFIDTYGCQQNEADSDRLRGLCAAMGYIPCESTAEADLIIINTCAVREHAEARVYGVIGALVHEKKRRPDLVIAVCGCMAQEDGTEAKLRKSYRHVDIVFGTFAIPEFPRLLKKAKASSVKGRPCTELGGDPLFLPDGLPILRKPGVRAGLPVMAGCDNFCSYCIVPYVRGRERSRSPAAILAEAEGMIQDGILDIMLLGQNVNSYRYGGVDFAALLRQVDTLPGDYWLRFMTSHPRDASDALFDAMQHCEHMAPALHLPFQSGSDAILAAMNRGYTAAHYLGLLEKARKAVRGIVITSDVMVGFPGETEADFQQTLALIEAAQFDALFTFLYSPRTGTPAAGLPDPVPAIEKQAWFDAMVKRQNEISAERHAAYVGKTVRALIISAVEARTPGGRLINLTGTDAKPGFADVLITGSSQFALIGTAT